MGNKVATAKVAIVDTGVCGICVPYIRLQGRSASSWGHGTVMAAVVASVAPAVDVVSVRLNDDADGCIGYAESVADIVLCAWTRPSVHTTSRARPEVPLVCADAGVLAYPATLPGAYTAPRVFGVHPVTFPFSPRAWRGASVAAARVAAWAALRVLEGASPVRAVQDSCSVPLVV